MAKQGYKQIKAGFEQKFKDHGVDVSGTRLPGPIPDPADSTKTIPNPNGTPATISAKVLINNERRGPAKDEENPSGLDSNLGKMIFMRISDVLQEDDLITTDDRDYQIGVVTPLSWYGKTYGYQAPLIEA